MAAHLPGSTPAENAANPSAGAVALMSPLTGPAGSPKVGGTDGSGCGLNTGIGFGSPPVIDPISTSLGSNAVAGIKAAGFSDDYTPGLTMPDGTAAVDSRLMVIGGGRTNADGSPGTPWSAGGGLVAAGNGGSRDGGGGAGFALKTTTAPGAVAPGAVVEAGFVNRSGVALVNSQSVFASASAAAAVPV